MTASNVPTEHRLDHVLPRDLPQAAGKKGAIGFVH